MRAWVAELRLRHSPYWRGYRAGISARERAHQKYLRLQRVFESSAAGELQEGREQ